MALQLISYGTRIRCGVYRVQARFIRAVNFVCGPALVALVTPDVGDGPINIVARTLAAVTDASVLKVTRTHVILDGVAHPKRRMHRYSAAMHVGPAAAPVFMENLRHCEEVLRQQAPPHSMPQLLATPGRSRFAQCLATRLRRGVRQLQRGEFAAGAGTLKGLGCGLTPSGDDFLAGFLLGCRVIEKLRGVDLAVQRHTILTHALGGNLLSNAFLHCASEGRPFACIRKLICALARPKAAAVRACTERLLAVGATSGADTAMGFLAAAGKSPNPLFKRGTAATEKSPGAPIARHARLPLQKGVPRLGEGRDLQ